MKITWKETANAEEYRLQVRRDGELLVDENLGLATAYELKSAQPGDYEVQVTAGNKTGSSKSKVCRFTVHDIYTVSYDARGGSGAPAAQTKVVWEVQHVSGDVPVREGYTFLGWTDDAQDSFPLVDRMHCRGSGLRRRDPVFAPAGKKKAVIEK